LRFSCSPLIYCRVLLKSLLVLGVLLLAYVFVGVAPVSAPFVVEDVAVVRGTDNGIYSSAYNPNPPPFGTWTSWVSLSGSTPSPPGICDVAGFGTVWLVVRGTDNGIYLKPYTTGTGWYASWIPVAGATIDTPACAYLGGAIHLVVRGTNNELYWNSKGAGWSGWQDLNGKSVSAPVLVSIPSLNRIDLFVQGTDNGIYHKAYTSGAWSSSWDSPGGKTLSKPAAAFDFNHVCNYGCSLYIDRNSLLLVVRGTDNNVYYNFLVSIDSVTPVWQAWNKLSGATLSAPTLAYDANGCSSASTVSCSSIDALAVRGTDNAVYHKTYSGIWSSGWDSPGGSIANSPALASVVGISGGFLLLVQGSPSNKLYSNTVTGPPNPTWSTYSSCSGATISDPALTAVL
jgi:hypothetical protein